MTGTQDPEIRARLAQVFESHCGIYAALLREAVEAGELPPGLDAAAAARGVLALVEGEVMLAKVEGSTDRLAGLAGRALALVRGCAEHAA